MSPPIVVRWQREGNRRRNEYWCGGCKEAMGAGCGVRWGLVEALMEERKESAASVGQRMLWCTVAQILNSVQIRR